MKTPLKLNLLGKIDLELLSNTQRESLLDFLLQETLKLKNTNGGE